MSDLEKTIESSFVKFVEERGDLCLKLRVDGVNGFPDRTIIMAGGVAFIEFKRNVRSHLRPAQVEMIRKLTELGADVIVTSSPDEAIKFYKDLKGEI